MADYPFKGYPNEVLENKILSILNTKLDINRFMTADYSLESNPGMKKVIHRYNGTGSAEDLARGEGNSEFVDAEYTSVEYEVYRTLGQAKWYDDDLMTDPTLIDAKIKYLSEGLVNNWTDKAIAEFAKTENLAPCTNFDLADFADAINLYTREYEDLAGLFVLANIEMIPVLRKMLGEYLQPTEDYIRTGAIGAILGVPVYTSKAVPKGIMFLATRDAVTAFMKKGLFLETDRDIDKKENFLVAARYSVIALTDMSKCIMMGEEQEDTVTATADVSAATVTGTCTEGAVVYAYDADGKEIGHATSAEGAYTISGFDGAVGDKVKVIARVDGFLPSIITVEAVA